MPSGRVRVKSGKAKRWKKGQSSSSNPASSKHREAAKGKFGSHLSQVGHSSAAVSLTTEALASHDASQEDNAVLGFEKLGDSELSNAGEEDDAGSITAATSVTSGTVYSLIETAHPVFGKVKRLWNSSVESHKEICAVLAAISEVIKANGGKDTEIEYFGALMTALESSEDEKSTTAIAYLLSVIMPKVSGDVLKFKYSTLSKILATKLSTYETSSSTALLKGLVTCQITLLRAQDKSVWSNSYTQRFFQMLLNFSIHPKPRLRKVVQSGLVSMLREGTPAGDFHPSAGLVAKHCKHVVEKGGVETATLHILGMLKDCLANFPTQLVKSLCEMILKLMALRNSVVRTTGLKVLHGLFSSVAGPQGITAELNAQLIAALYDYQPSLVDAQLLQAWLTVMPSAHTSLSLLDSQLCVGHLPKLFTCCVNCMLSEKSFITKAAARVMETLLKECVKEYLASVFSENQRMVVGKDGSKQKSTSTSAKLTNIQSLFKAVESGLKYKYYSSWKHVLQVLGVFYQVAGSMKECQKFMSNSLSSLCQLRSTDNFPYTSELDASFGAAVKSMGPRVVLSVVPLQLDREDESHDFPHSWMLPVLKDYIEHTELAYFTEDLLPLAAKLQARGLQYTQAGKSLEAKLYHTLQYQIWSLLPGFCTEPVDLEMSFSSIARILGTALNEREELRPIVCQSLRLLIERNIANDANKAGLAKFSKNYLPILFNLYTTSSDSQANKRAPLLLCIQAYLSITDSKLLEMFFSKTLNKAKKEDISPDTRHLLFDVILTFIPHLSLEPLVSLFQFVSPLLDSGDSTLQKKCYSCLDHMLSCDSPSHQAFHKDHLDSLSRVLLDSLSTSSAASKKPRLKCLAEIVDRLTPDKADFIEAVTPEIILCTKEVNEKARMLSFKILINLGYAAQRCYRKSAEEALKDYFIVVLAGLAGSPHMVSATLLSLSRLVYEFHDLLGTELIKKLLTSVCVFLSSKNREVVRSALEFIKVIIGVLHRTELESHVEDLVVSILRWSENTRNHFRLKARVILERLIRKCSFEMVANFVPDKNKKLIVHIHKMNERQKRKKLSKLEDKKGDSEKGQGYTRVSHKPSYEELLLDSSDEEEEDKKIRRGKKQLSGKQQSKSGGRAWIKESSGDEPVNFLDPSVIQQVVATDPAKMGSRKAKNPFTINREGKLVIDDEEEQGRADTVKEQGDEEMEIDQSNTRKRKRPTADDFEDLPHADGDRPEPFTAGGGAGIHRKNPHKRDHDFDYGAEYRSKKAKGDVKKTGKPDPYAYMPLLRHKLNRRKKAGLTGQFAGIMSKAKKGSALGRKQLKRKR